MKAKMKQAKPFLKWAGGKTQLLNEISAYYPFSQGIKKYAEPFVGGGAVLFDILNKYSLEKVYISDINEELINTYKVVRDDVRSLIYILKDYEEQFLLLQIEGRKEFYNEKRKEFNDLKINNTKNLNVKKAALMIFLNRTCFNGLFRVNRKGEFNVPMGNYKNPVICDVWNLTSVSFRLQNVEIVCGDYRESESFIDKTTFVYFDPPYRPLTKTSSFTAYTEGLFNDENQKELAAYVTKINNRGAKVVVSNSDPKNTNSNDNFFDNIYRERKIKRVSAKRMINCQGQSRGEVKELLISNY